MPGQFRLSVDLLVKEAGEIAALGIPAIILFGIPDRKDDRGSRGSIRMASCNGPLKP
jgi:Delta-aminolevulinic acid dehydratase